MGRRPLDVRTRSALAPDVIRATIGWLLLVLALGAIGLATLPAGDPLALEPTGHLCLVCGSQGSIDVLQNVVLFVPVGIALGLLGVSWPRAALAGCLVSAGVELAQLTVVVGRSPTASDLLTNTTGAALGAVLVSSGAQWLAPDRPLARRLTAAVWLAWTTILAATAYGLAPSAARRITINELPPNDAFVREYGGAMREWSLTGSTATGAEPVTFRGSQLPRVVADPSARDFATTARTARLLAADTIVARATVHAMLPPGKLRPLVVVHDEEWNALLLIGHQRQRAVLRQRTRSSELRFRSPEVALAAGFPAAAAIARGSDPARGPVVTLTGRMHRDGLTVAVEDADGVRVLTMPRTPLVGWLLLAPQWIRYDARGPLLTALWVAAFLLPLAYWASLAAGAVTPGSLLALGAAVALPVLGAAWLGGLALPRAAEWGAVALALAGGLALAHAWRRRNGARNLAEPTPAHQYTPP